MAKEPKTKPTNVNVSDFLETIEPERRRADARDLTTLLQRLSGCPPVMWGSNIVGFDSYASLSGDWPIIGFSPRKAELVVYIMPGFEAVAPLLEKLGPHRTGKSCLYIRRLETVDAEVLEQICLSAIVWMRQQYKPPEKN